MSVRYKHIAQMLGARFVLPLWTILGLTLLLSSFAESQLEITTPADSSVSRIGRQAIIAKTIPGFDAALFINGNQIRSGKVRADGLIEFLNVDVPNGPVHIEVRLLNPDGTPAMMDTRTIHILGPVHRLTMDVPKDELQADSTALMEVVLRAEDQWGYRIPDGVVITVATDRGAILNLDIDSARTGIQIPVKNGEARFTYQPSTSSGLVSLYARADQVDVSHEIFLLTPVEPLTVVGLITGKAGFYTAGGDRSVLENQESYPDGTRTEGRAAVYARGSVYENYLLTASIDTDRRNRSRFFREIDPDYLYSIYGDNSMLFYDAQTNRNFFAKIERNQSYVMVGDYNTEVNGQEFAAYNRSLNGAKVYVKEKQWNVLGFGALTDRRPVQKMIRGQGLSGFYILGSTTITPGSDKVRIETHNKYHSETILKSSERQRFLDYEIDYQQGLLFFKQPVPGIDDMENPVYIVVNFEEQNGQASSYIAGGRVENTFVQGLTIGVNGMTEEQLPTNYTLLGADAKYSLNEFFAVNGEYGRSSTIVGSGQAYKIESSVSPMTGLSFRGYYREVGAGFTNISQLGGRGELGSKKYGIGTNYQPWSSTRFSGEYYTSIQNTGAVPVNQTAGAPSTINSLSAGVDHQFLPSLNGQLRVENLEYEGALRDTTQGSVSTQSTLMSGKLAYNLSDRLTLSVAHDRNFGSQPDLTRPNATMIQGEFKATQDISISAQQKFMENGGSVSAIGASTNVLEGTSVYGRYEIGNAIAGNRNVVSIGLRNRMKITDDVTGNIGYEKTKSLEQRLGQTPTDDHSAYFVSMEYLPKRPLKVSTKAEFGEDSRSTKSNFGIAADYRFEQDLSVILKYRNTDENDVKTSNYRSLDHLIVGFAFRPARYNWLNAVGKFEIKRDNNHYIQPFIDYGASIASIHAYVEPAHRLEVGMKYAFKVSQESSQDFSAIAHTNFILLRAEYDLLDYLDIGGEFRTLHQVEVGDYVNGYSLDAGYVVAKNFQIRAGYNFKGYKERDLVPYSLWSNGPFISGSFKFGEDLFGY